MAKHQKTDIVTLPAHWACALINGDYTGFDFSCEDGGEARRCSAAEDRLADDGWSVVSMVDDSERFSWSYRLYDAGTDVDGGDVADYVILRTGREG